jgi:hypothetical protein
MSSASAEERVKSEVAWMKSEFNLSKDQEKRVHDVLLKYEKPQSGQTGQAGQSGQGVSSTSANQEAKDREIKAIIGDQNFQLYKKHESEKKSGSGSTSTPSSSSDRNK